MLKFHPTQASKRPYLSEYYDEQVFVNPSSNFAEIVKSTIVEPDPEKEEMRKNQMEQEMNELDRDSKATALLSMYNGQALKENCDWTQQALTEFSNFDENIQTSLIEDAMAYVKSEMETITGKIMTTEDDIKRLKSKANSNSINSHKSINPL